MQNQNVDLLIKEADHLLDTASHELERSQEDVMAYTVCYNSRQSIVNYLSSYLLQNSVEIKSPVTVAGLMEQCRKEDGRFQLIDISSIMCNHDETDEAYCLNIEKVSECLRIAKLTRNIVISDSPTH